MAISVRASGTWAVSTTQSPTVTIPSGYQSGDLGILVSVWRPYTVTATVNQSWNEIVDESPGTTANGVGVGSSRVYVAYKVLGSSETNPTLTRSGAITPGGQVIIVLQKGAADGSWTVEKIATAVEQAMGSTAMSHALTTTAAIKASDLVFALTGVADDSATFTRATTAISGGPSWSGNVVEYPATHASSTTGNDMAADLIYRVASTAQASGASITVTATLSAAERVASTLFRVYAPQVLTPDFLDAGPALYAPTIAHAAGAAQTLTLGLLGGGAGAAAHGQNLGTATNNTAAQTTTVLSPSAKTVTVGNVIVVGWGCYYNITPTGVTDNLGNTYARVERTTASTVTSDLWYAPVTTGGSITTITVAHASTQYVAITAAELSGVSTSAPSVGGGTTGVSTTATWASSKTIPANGIIIGYIHINGASAASAGAASGSPSTSISLSASWVADQVYAMAYAVAGSTQVTTFTGTVTVPSSADWAGTGAIFSPGAGEQAVLYAPTLTQTAARITLGLLESTPALYAPTLSPGPVTLTLALLDSVRALYAPTLAPKSTLTLTLLDAGPTLYAPTLTPKWAITLTLLDGAPALYAPALASKYLLSLTLLDAGAGLFAPTLTQPAGLQTLSPDHLDASPALYAPTLAPQPVTLTLTLLDAGPTLYAPALVPKWAITLTLLNAGPALYAPTIVAGPVTLTLGLLDAGPALYAPALIQLGGVQTLAPSFLDSGPALYAPSLLPGAVTLTLGLLDSGRTQYAPTLLPGAVTLTIAILDAGRLLYAPTLIPGPVVIGLDLLESAAVLYAPTLGFFVTSGIPPLNAGYSFTPTGTAAYPAPPVNTGHRLVAAGTAAHPVPVGDASTPRPEV